MDIPVTTTDGPAVRQAVTARPEAGQEPGAVRAWMARRAGELVSALSLDEKIAMLHQYSPGVPRLGIPPFRTGTEALHGAAWLGPATVFPQAVGLGASWDSELASEVGQAAGREVRVLHQRDQTVSLNVWAPVVNLLRDPRWGRNEEGYSEDPYLTSVLAMAYCRGLRGGDPVYLRTAPLLKHFLAYNNETGRDITSASVRPRVLHEYDLPPFRAPVEAGLAVGVMPSYNLVNARPNHVSPYLASEFRRWSSEELIVCSDAEAPTSLVENQHYFPDHETAHAAALLAGVDSFTDHGSDSSFVTGRIRGALRRGLITVADVDQAVTRLLLLRLRLGEFTPGGGPFTEDDSVLTCAGHAALARRAARQAVVVLKNDAEVLPLAAGPGTTIAVVGPLAAMACEDWYSGTLPYQVTIADGLGDALAERGAAVAVSEAVDRVVLRAVSSGAAIGPLAAGPGEPPVLAALDGAAGGQEFDVFDWGENVVALRAEPGGRFVTVTGEGTLTATAAQPNGWVVRETFVVEPAPGAPAGAGRMAPEGVVLKSTATGGYLRLTGGVLTADAPDRAAAEPLAWDVVGDGTAGAVTAMRDAGAVVVVVGNHPLVNGRECQDRAGLALPPSQDRLIRAARAAHDRVVLLVVSSYPYAIGWAQRNVPAIVWTCHGGQEAGRAVADVLLGEQSPSGRLPQTWYASTGDLPPLQEYDIIKARRTYLYSRAVPLYPFGHGLAYTTFGYSALRVEPATAGAGDTVEVTVEVTNTGTREGTEVVQVYTRAVAPRHERPLRQLAGFTRVTLRPGESRQVTVAVPVETLAFWDVATHRMTVDPGEYEIMAGRSSAAIEQTAKLVVSGEPPGPRPLAGAWVAAADFDDHEGIMLVDATPDGGDAVTPASARGWILLRAADLGEGGAMTVTARVAREEPGSAALDLWCGHPARGRYLGSVAVPSTGGRYRWVEVSAPLHPADGTRDVYAVLGGRLRLAALRIDRPGGPGPG